VSHVIVRLGSRTKLSASLIIMRIAYKWWFSYRHNTSSPKRNIEIGSIVFSGPRYLWLPPGR
jgi:hypothetical protein